jgi:hypothetical protein
VAVYFARAGQDGPIKIGYTAGDPLGRIADLQTGCAWRIFLIGAVEGDTRHEAWLHARFAEFKTEGEWFRPADPIEASILEMTSPGFVWPALFEARAPKPLTKLGQWLDLKGISQAKFGLMIGCSQAAVARYAAGKRFPGERALIAIYVATNGDICPNDFVTLPELGAVRRAA